MTIIEPSRSELGNFLRSRRERLSPAAFKIASGRRRRTPGLRREEVAELAGIGVDWYIRLEQGRSVNPSVTTIDALARALRLTKAEHAHLQVLTRKLYNRAERAAFIRETVPPAVERVLLGIPQPAYITGRRWDVLAWNAAANELFAFSRRPQAERNLLIGMLIDPDVRRLFGNAWTQEAQRMVAEFRAAYAPWADDPAFIQLVQCLSEGNFEFASWWRDHEIGKVSSGRKSLIHPEKGVVNYEYASFQSNDDPALRLVVFSAGTR